MLTGIRIRGFRCFDDFECQPLRRLNLIGGGNNAGKTTLLEGIFLLAGANNASLPTHVNTTYRGRGHFIFDPSHVWGNLFSGMESSKPIEIVGARKDGTVALTVELEPSRETIIEVQGRKPEEAALGALICRSRLNGQSVEVRSEIKSIGGSVQITSSPFVNPIIPAVYIFTRGIDPEFDADRYGQLEKNNSEKALSDLLGALRMLEPRLKRLSVITEGPVKSIHGALDGLGPMLPLWAMGGGMVRLASLLLAIYVSRNGIVLVDEIENGLYHHLMPDVWKALSRATREFNVQLFATTHSYECIRAACVALPEERADIGYCRLERVKGVIHAIPYDPEVIEAAMDQGSEVR